MQQGVGHTASKPIPKGGGAGRILRPEYLQQCLSDFHRQQHAISVRDVRNVEDTRDVRDERDMRDVGDVRGVRDVKDVGGVRNVGAHGSHCPAGTEHVIVFRKHWVSSKV